MPLRGSPRRQSQGGTTKTRLAFLLAVVSALGLSATPAIAGRSYNHATTGADMADLNGQMAAAVSRGTEYVTVLMGANDVCASSESGMTPVATFGAQFEQALVTFTTGRPGARIFVSSIPDIHQLFSVYRWDVAANSVWAIAGICQSMVAYPFSNLPWDVARRASVRQRNIDYSTQLAQVSAFYTTCRFDGNAVFNTAFVRPDITTRDYFHPSVNGQAKLAAATWGRWPTSCRSGRSAWRERQQHAAVVVVAGEDVHRHRLRRPRPRAELELLAHAPDAPLERDSDRVGIRREAGETEGLDDVLPHQLGLPVARQLEDTAAGREHAAVAVAGDEPGVRAGVVVVEQLEEEAEAAPLAGDGLLQQALFAVVVERAVLAVRADEERHGR
ncbi:MAG: hypothetical protein H0T13_08830 [Actinobacteria bacterium]|nr:hypothetical protein [Actinomycetota bacterium]